MKAHHVHTESTREKSTSLDPNDGEAERERERDGCDDRARGREEGRRGESGSKLRLHSAHNSGCK